MSISSERNQFPLPGETAVENSGTNKDLFPSITEENHGYMIDTLWLSSNSQTSIIHQAVNSLIFLAFNLMETDPEAASVIGPIVQQVDSFKRNFTPVMMDARRKILSRDWTAIKDMEV